ncbi:MAG: flagellar basal body-associated FliL family protein [Myxococcales bacterium]|jgi:flagellar basal body-associated protein FliL|nr:flagellar basal body-associated FliL family protein [Myxococcales bacterium]
MSEKPPAAGAAKTDKPDDAAKPKKKGAIFQVVALLLPALLAAGAAYGASRVTMGKAAAAHGNGHEADGDHKEHEKEKEKPKYDPRPPGPTVALEPFLLTLPAADKKPHAMRLTLAIEFDSHTKEDAIKAFTPRIRDAVLTYLRSMSYEEMADRDKQEKVRKEILERIHASGALSAERILVTDLVLQ